MTQETIKHWEYSIGGETYSDGYFGSVEEARESAQNEYADYIVEYEEPRNGEVFSEDLGIVLMEDDEFTGDSEILEILQETVEYEHYHGDLAEHGLTMRDVL